MNTNLIQQIQRYGDEYQREDIRRRDDRCQYHDTEEGVAAVACHEGGFEQAHFGQDPADDRELEDESHGECQRGEGGDVAIERDDILHGGVDLIGTQEAEGDREEDEIIHQYADHEEDVDARGDEDGILLLVVVERRTDVSQYLI